MRYRKLSGTGDYTFGGNLNSFHTNVPAAPGQAVMTRLLLFLGEWFLDTGEGTPWFNATLGNFQHSNADSSIQDRVLGTQGITGITNYQSVLNSVTRQMNVQMNVETIYGSAQIGVTNIAPVGGGRLLTQSGIVITTQGGTPITS